MVTYDRDYSMQISFNKSLKVHLGESEYNVHINISIEGRRSIDSLMQQQQN